MKTASNNAVPKLSMTNPSPIILLVNKSISAFTTNKNNPSVTIVAGNVNSIRIGRMSILIIANTILASIAVPILSTTKLGINHERNRNKSALTKIPPNHFIRTQPFSVIIVLSIASSKYKLKYIRLTTEASTVFYRSII